MRTAPPEAIAPPHTAHQPGHGESLHSRFASRLTFVLAHCCLALAAPGTGTLAWASELKIDLSSRHIYVMTLGEFAYLLNVDAKWVQNVAASLGGRMRYTLRTAQRLAVARALADALGASMPQAYAAAGDVLRRYDGSRQPVRVSEDEAPVVVTLDVYRVLAVVNTGLSRLRTSYAPRRRGRPAGARDPIAAAAEHGLDTTLLAANLRRTPAERLRQLDGMLDFPAAGALSVAAGGRRDI